MGADPRIRAVVAEGATGQQLPAAAEALRLIEAETLATQYRLRAI